MSTESGVHAFVVDDVDLSMEIGSRFFYDMTVEPVRSGKAFFVDTRIGAVGESTAALVRYGTELSAQVIGHEDAYQVNIPLHGALDMSVARTEFTATPEAAAVIGPVGLVGFRGWRTVAEQLFMLKIDRRALERELDRLLGRDTAGAIRFEPLLDLRTGPGARWLSLARPIVDDLGSGEGLVWNPLFAAQFSSTLMMSLLLAADHNYRDDLDARSRPAQPATIRRAVTFIEEHAHDPITVPLIAAAVGCSVRTLHRGFEEHLDTTPVAYLTRVRLDRTHRELLAATPELASVSDIASRWGFEHLGRFAARYRSAFGKLPSHTLRGM